MRNTRLLLLGLALPITAGFFACDTGKGAPSATVRDSAGVTIVENHTGSWRDEHAWRVSPEPSLNIGVLEGAPEYQLYQVRSALRLSNGNIVVAASNELRFFDANGRYLSTSGREGGGPGEFQSLGWIKPHLGDSIVAYDFSQRRVSLFESTGSFGRSYNVTPEGESGFVMGENVFEDGTLLVKAPQLFRGGISDGAARHEEDFFIYSNEGEFLDSVATFPGPDQFIRTGGDGERRFVAVTTPPFGKETVMDVFGGCFYFGSADTYEVGRYSKDGTLEMLVRRDQEPRPVTESDIASYVAQELEDIEDDNALRDKRDTFEEMPSPDFMPAYRGIKLDDVGNLWVQEFDPDEDAPSVWTVFDPEGQLLGPVTLAAGFEVNQIGDDFLLGVWRDDYDVEHVHMYGLIKPELGER